MITWILDQHVDKVRGAPTPFLNIARDKGHIVYGLRDSFIPKPVDLSNIKINGPAIIRGSHGFVNHVQNTLNLFPGGFLHPLNFQLMTYSKYLGSFCIHDNFKIIEYGDFSTNRKIFVKPLEDIKKFNGLVVDAGQTIATAHMEKFGKWFEPNQQCKLIVSEVREIEQEYRVVVVDGNPITGSTYDMNDGSCPEMVFDFVRNIAAIWNPIDVYVVDVAITDAGCKIVEYNQFSTSAMYGCDQNSILDALDKKFP